MIQYLINIIDYAEYKYLAIIHKESTKILVHGRVGKKFKPATIYFQHT